MKVLVISASFPPMGIGEADHAFHLCRQLADRNCDVHVLTTKRDEVATDPHFRVYPIMERWSWWELPRFAGFLRRCSPDVVLLMFIGFMYNDHPMVTFSPTVSRIVQPRVRFVTQFMNAIDVRRQRWSIPTRVVRKAVKVWAKSKDVDYEFGTLLRDSDRIVALSDTHRAKLSKHLRGVSDKSVVIPPPPLMRICPENNGVSRQRGRQILGLQSNDFLIAYFGYIYPFKGVETLLKAFQLVSTYRHNVRLVLVGGVLARKYSHRPYYAEEMHELSKELGIADRVTWTGAYAWDSDEASIYLRAADACVLPFDYGLYLNNSSFAAAAAHGLPIITTRGEKLEEVFRDRENVLLCPPKSPEAIASAIETLIEEPDVRQRVRKGALRLAREWFSWDRAIEQTIATMV